MSKRRHSASSEFGIPGKRCLASASVSIILALSRAARPMRANSASRKPKSNGALCATSGSSAKNSSNSAAISANFGLPATSALVMPCTRLASAGMSRSGSISVWNTLPVGRSFHSSIAATSITRSPPSGSNPVVSVSNSTARDIAVFPPPFLL